MYEYEDTGSDIDNNNRVSSYLTYKLDINDVSLRVKGILAPVGSPPDDQLIYMDMDKFKEADIEIIIQSYEHPQYSQLWAKENNGDFISHLSVIDLLFNCGEKSLEVLIGKNKK